MHIIYTCTQHRITERLLAWHHSQGCISLFESALRITVYFCLVCAGLAAAKAVQSFCESSCEHSFLLTVSVACFYQSCVFFHHRPSYFSSTCSPDLAGICLSFFSSLCWDNITLTLGWAKINIMIIITSVLIENAIKHILKTKGKVFKINAPTNLVKCTHHSCRQKNHSTNLLC